MKIELKRIPEEGVSLIEDASGDYLGLNTEIVRFISPVRIKADVGLITNALTVHMEISSLMIQQCSRCLKEFKVSFSKCFDLNYSVDNNQQSIDLDPDIREEIILGYPINPLCKKDCKGLCLKCGKNLNEEKCSCS